MNHFLKEAINAAQNKYKQFNDRRRHESSFQVGNLVVMLAIVSCSKEVFEAGTQILWSLWSFRKDWIGCLQTCLPM